VLCSGGLQGTLEVIRDSHFHNFSVERERPYRRLRRCELRRVEAWDAEDCYTRETRTPGYQETFPSCCRPGAQGSGHIPLQEDRYSKSSATIGMLVVAFLAAVTASGAAAKMTCIFSRTRSPATSGINSGMNATLAKRYSIARFLPST
jgi:hypothetical protein